MTGRTSPVRRAATLCCAALAFGLSGCITDLLPPKDGNSSHGAQSEAPADPPSLEEELVDKDLALAIDSTFAVSDENRFRMNSDGTVTGTDEVLLLISKATHWRIADETIDFCTSESCEYWSSWSVEATDAPKDIDGYFQDTAYAITLKGDNNEDGEPVRRTILILD